MSKYYCPFCSSRYEFQKTRSDGVFICGHCGDPLMKKPLISSRQIIGFVSVTTFVAPLLIMTVFVVHEFNKDKLPNNSKSLVF